MVSQKRVVHTELNIQVDGIEGRSLQIYNIFVLDDFNYAYIITCIYHKTTSDIKEITATAFPLSFLDVYLNFDKSMVNFLPKFMTKETTSIYHYKFSTPRL